jgi:hypothetical protein
MVGYLFLQGLNLKNLVYLTFLVVFAACAPKEEAAFRTTKSGLSGTMAPSYWNGGLNAFPLNLSISSDFSVNETSAIIDTANNWTTSTGNNNQLFDTSANTTEKNTINLNSFQDDVMGIYKVTAWPSDLPQTALAVTQIFGIRRNIGSSSEIIEMTHADILVNYQNFSFSTTNGFGYDLQTVVLHEMGHFLGLYHDDSSKENSVMYPTISRFVTNRTPKDSDILNLSNKYGLSGHGVVQAGARRLMASVKSSDEEIGKSEEVVIHFEIHPNGVEHLYIVSANRNESPQQKINKIRKTRKPSHTDHNKNCNHNTIVHKISNPAVFIEVPGVRLREREQLKNKKGTI